jgi:hypothetical protein
MNDAGGVDTSSINSKLLVNGLLFGLVRQLHRSEMDHMSEPWGWFTPCAILNHFLLHIVP